MISLLMHAVLASGLTNVIGPQEIENFVLSDRSAEGQACRQKARQLARAIRGTYRDGLLPKEEQNLGTVAAELAFFGVTTEDLFNIGNKPARNPSVATPTAQAPAAKETEQTYAEVASELLDFSKATSCSPEIAPQLKELLQNINVGRSYGAPGKQRMLSLSRLAIRRLNLIGAYVMESRGLQGEMTQSTLLLTLIRWALNPENPIRDSIRAGIRLKSLEVDGGNYPANVKLTDEDFEKLESLQHELQINARVRLINAIIMLASQSLETTIKAAFPIDQD